MHDKGNQIYVVWIIALNKYIDTLLLRENLCDTGPWSQMKGISQHQLPVVSPLEMYLPSGISYIESLEALGFCL